MGWALLLTLCGSFTNTSPLTFKRESGLVFFLVFIGPRPLPPAPNPLTHTCESRVVFMFLHDPSLNANPLAYKPESGLVFLLVFIGPRPLPPAPTPLTHTCESGVVFMLLHNPFLNA